MIYSGFLAEALATAFRGLILRSTHECLEYDGVCGREHLVASVLTAAADRIELLVAAGELRSRQAGSVPERALSWRKHWEEDMA